MERRLNGFDNMNTTINWKTATDAEKNACFAEQVVGWQRQKCENFHFTYTNGLIVGRRHLPEPEDGWLTPNGYNWPLGCAPDYLHSADAILPWLEQSQFQWDIFAVRNRVDNTLYWRVGVFNTKYYAYASNLPEAAMIALLRAKGVEVLT